jgi:hypothetical protein
VAGYRCRFVAEYALANHVQHTLTVNLREDLIIGQVDRAVNRSNGGATRRRMSKAANGCASHRYSRYQDAGRQREQTSAVQSLFDRR